MAGTTTTGRQIVYIPGRTTGSTATIKKNIQSLIDSGKIKISADQVAMIGQLSTPQEIAAFVSGQFGLKVSQDDWSITEFPSSDIGSPPANSGITQEEWNNMTPEMRNDMNARWGQVDDTTIDTGEDGDTTTEGGSIVDVETYQGDMPTTTLEWMPDEWNPDNNILDIFDKRAKYEIPEEVFQMLEEYKTGAGKIEELYGKSREQILAEARRAQKDVLAETRRTGEQALDIFRTRAYGGLPGERQMYEQLGASTAGAIRDVTQRGGGGGQGAIADIYGQQQAGIRGIGMQRAQYQAAGMEGLGQMVRQTGLDMSSAYRTMAQDYMQANLATTQALGGAYQTGTAMRTTGLGNLANYRDIQWQLNQQQPALAREAFLIDEYRRHDPFFAEMAMYGGEAGMNYAMAMQGQQGQSNAIQQLMNTMGQGVSGYMQMDYINKWFNQNSSGNE